MIHPKNNYNVIGLMSGTSLDGVDIAYCNFNQKNKTWSYKIYAAETIKYNSAWHKKLSTANQLSASDFMQLDREYGSYLGELLKKFISKNKLKRMDFIASHGHTVFHQPQNKFTVQIGHGAAIAAGCDLPVVCDFRSTDVAHGGQGAPLVPIGDKLLFSEYDFCLNLGGFANVSFEKSDKRIAFDICPVNIVLNELAERMGRKFDRGGALAKKGELNHELLKKLNALSFYKKQYPKSLGREWILTTVNPLIEQSKLSPVDLLRTFTEHIAFQIAKATKGRKIFVTGGGVYNDFLLARIGVHTRSLLVIPDKTIIEFKEALIFAFLGVLRYRGEINSLCTVTGADKNSSGGAIYL